ncbi:hypothetical protein [Bradyrhizobium sp.]|uniref:hypothetical protein n=1 Tax=Bradyrhizobium sp. TaxID=376 RepID=UPI003C726976
MERYPPGSGQCQGRFMTGRSFDIDQNVSCGPVINGGNARSLTSIGQALADIS